MEEEASAASLSSCDGRRSPTSNHREENVDTSSFSIHIKKEPEMDEYVEEENNNTFQINSDHQSEDEEEEIVLFFEDTDEENSDYYNHHYNGYDIVQQQQQHHYPEAGEDDDCDIKPLFPTSLYQVVKEEGYIIPPTTTFEETAAKGQVYVCSEEGCNSRFFKRAYLEQHMCIHTSDRPYMCPSVGCNKSYKRKDHLNRHVKYCPLSPGGGLPPVLCTVEGCNRTFISNTNLRKHVQVYHENKKKKIQCLLAEYSNVVKSEETKLIGSASEQTTRPDFDISSPTPFGCPHAGCDMSFRWMNRLKRHMKVHEGYTCPECGEKFEKWPQLVKHKTAAHKEPQKCPICERTFAQGQWLKRHMKVHSDVREMYLCPYENCSRCYSEKRNLDAHIRSYHNKERYSCVFEDCGRSFAFKHKMLDHLKIHCIAATEEANL